MFHYLTSTTQDVVTAADWAPVLDIVKTQFSVETMVAVIGSVLAGGLGLWFMWWGLRKAFATLTNAAKGKGIRP